MWRPVTSGMVDVIYIGYAAFAGAFDTKRATICRLQTNFTFDKCEFTAHGRSIRLTGMTNCVQGGKYGAGIIYYFSFFLWRHHSTYAAYLVHFVSHRLSKSGNSDRGASFILFCLFGTVYSIYSCSWVGFDLICTCAQKCFQLS
jgi:hypothetical protein